ncbi:Mpo1 family 2-hydroxy fatty acid dioxygenase [Rheinheimera sp. NSM]|uniref:Mpo1 family 2-hydroxy fatty acid dioxygenase n=1 Tax=Rheinheimera sp. NSM TaxID=3457884 RepID=UPI004035DC48
MKNLTEHLSQYARYHRDERNILTHYAGIPLILVAVFSLLYWPLFSLAGIVITPALVLFIGGMAFYLRLDLRFGLVMFIFSGISLLLAAQLAALPFWLWLGSSVALFVVGWVLQFIGHYYEGKKPAFVDDLVGLLVGPLFIVAELSFKLGLRKPLQQDIEQNAGKTH